MFKLLKGFFNPMPFSQQWQTNRLFKEKARNMDLSKIRVHRKSETFASGQPIPLTVAEFQSLEASSDFWVVSHVSEPYFLFTLQEFEALMSLGPKPKDRLHRLSFKLTFEDYKWDFLECAFKLARLDLRAEFGANNDRPIESFLCEAKVQGIDLRHRKEAANDPLSRFPQFSRHPWHETYAPEGRSSGTSSSSRRKPSRENSSSSSAASAVAVSVATYAAATAITSSF